MRNGCSKCDKKFTQAGNLKTHERIHAGSKPFSCSQCTKAFTSAQSLKKHALKCAHCKRGNWFDWDFETWCLWSATQTSQISMLHISGIRFVKGFEFGTVYFRSFKSRSQSLCMKLWSLLSVWSSFSGLLSLACYHPYFGEIYWRKHTVYSKLKTWGPRSCQFFQWLANSPMGIYYPYCRNDKI